MRSLSIVVWLASISAIAAISAAAASPLGYRLQLWGYLPALKVLVAAALVAAVGVVLALVGIYLGWRAGQPLRLYWSVAALIVGLVVVAPVASWVRTARAVPRIHDISTDTENPPAFVEILKARAGAANTADYGGPDVARRQHAGYPDIMPLRLRVPPARAFAAALEAARAMNWIIIASDAAAGRIEASDRTFWYGFVDDVVVRVAPAPDGSRVDVRSVSRVGISDLGTNARRIRSFLRRVSESSS